MAGSWLPPLTSFTQFTPSCRAASATSARNVSTESTGSGPNRWRTARITGATRSVSTADPTSTAPGRVLWPPRSRIWAPALRWALQVSTAWATLVMRPPSLKLSGVRFTTAITAVRPGAKPGIPLPIMDGCNRIRLSHPEPGLWWEAVSQPPLPGSSCPFLRRSCRSCAYPGTKCGPGRPFLPRNGKPPPTRRGRPRASTTPSSGCSG